MRYHSVLLLLTLAFVGLMQGCASTPHVRQGGDVVVDDWYEVVNPQAHWVDRYTKMCKYQSGVVVDVGLRADCPDAPKLAL